MLAHRLVSNDNGPLIVFLHAVGATSWMWEPVVKHLPGHTCLLINLPGHGQSNAIAWHSLEDSARRVQDTVEAVCQQRDCKNGIRLVGLSLGAYVAMTLLTQKPAFYESATLSGMHAGPIPNKLFMQIMSWVVAPFALRLYMARKTATMFGASEADALIYLREAGKTHVPSFRQATIDVVNYEIPNTSAAIKTSVIVAAGSNEHSLILSNQQTIADALPHAEVYIADGVGHGWSYEDPEQFAALVVQSERAELALEET